MNFTALIPMKGHSERVPNKNMKLFNGKPLCYWILDKVSRITRINRIIVNTDSDVISEFVNQNFPNVEIFQRPESLRDEFISMEKIIEHDVIHSGDEYFFQTFSTCPLLTIATIENSLKKFRDQIKETESYYSVTRIQKRLYRENGQPLNHTENMVRTQDIPPVFERNACFYIFSKTDFIKNGSKRIGTNTKMVEMNKLESFDIDEESDFFIAETIFKRLIE